MSEIKIRDLAKLTLRKAYLKSKKNYGPYMILLK